MDQAETDSQFTKLVCSLMARETAERSQRLIPQR